MRAEPAPPPASGFSLIEVMVALAIFGLAAVALIRLQGVSLASATTLAERTQAALVARNQALEAWAMALPPGPASGHEQAGQHRLAWTRQTGPGPDPGTVLIAVSVAGSDGRVIATDQLLWSRR